MSNHKSFHLSVNAAFLQYFTSHKKWWNSVSLRKEELFILWNVYNYRWLWMVMISALWMCAGWGRTWVSWVRSLFFLEPPSLRIYATAVKTPLMRTLNEPLKRPMLTISFPNYQKWVLYCTFLLKVLTQFSP